MKIRIAMISGRVIEGTVGEEDVEAVKAVMATRPFHVAPVGWIRVQDADDDERVSSVNTAQAESITVVEG
jgi:hypothetical protein